MRHFLTFVLFAGFSTFPLLSSSLEDRQANKELRDRLHKAPTPGEKGKIYRLLFQKIDRERLIDFTKDDDTEIALQAAWELNKRIGTKPDKMSKKQKYDPDELAKFVKYLKERTKSPVPNWWEEAIVDVEFNSSGHLFRKYSDQLTPKIKTIKDVGNVLDGASLEREDGKLTYNVGEKRITFDESTFDTTLESSYFVGTFREKFAAVAYCYFPAGFHFQLASFNLMNGKPIWLKDVWATGRETFLGPEFELHRVDLRSNDEKIFVFGAEPHGMYLEAFENASGKCLYRFCTSYWSNFSESWDK